MNLARKENLFCLYFLNVGYNAVSSKASLLTLGSSFLSNWTEMSTKDSKSLNLLDISSVKSEASLAILLHSSLNEAEAEVSLSEEEADLLVWLLILRPWASLLSALKWSYDIPSHLVWHTIGPTIWVKFFTVSRYLGSPNLELESVTIEG